MSACLNCHNAFSRMPNTKHCSAKCREQWKYALKKADGRYLLDKARKRETYVHHTRQPSPPLYCNETDCQRQHHAHGLCKMHDKRRRTEMGLNPPTRWTDSRRSNHHARRARLNGARNSDQVLLADIITRDGTTCARCGNPIDLDLAWPNRYSRSIDHTVPLSKGGQHTLDNTTLMHLTCNCSKGDRTS